jgi:hypothetical protein
MHWAKFGVAVTSLQAYSSIIGPFLFLNGSVLLRCLIHFVIRANTELDSSRWGNLGAENYQLCDNLGVYTPSLHFCASVFSYLTDDLSFDGTYYHITQLYHYVCDHLSYI